jgi:hypothetical protein
MTFLFHDLGGSTGKHRKQQFLMKPKTPQHTQSSNLDLAQITGFRAKSEKKRGERVKMGAILST